MVSVIVAVFRDDSRRQDNFLQFANCLDRQTHKDYQFIVVEQYDDRPVYSSLIKANNIRCQYYALQHTGFCRAWLHNVGAKLSDGDTLIFMDADVVFGSDYLSCLHAIQVSTYTMGWDKVIYLNKAGRDWYLSLGCYQSEVSDDRIERVAVADPYGAAGLVSVFDRGFFFDVAGGYNESIPEAGGEDNDIMARSMVLTGKRQTMAYTLLHLPHGCRIRSKRNGTIWEFVRHNMDFVTGRILDQGIGLLDHPMPPLEGVL